MPIHAADSPLTECNQASTMANDNGGLTENKLNIKCFMYVSA